MKLIKKYQSAGRIDKENSIIYLPWNTAPLLEQSPLEYTYNRFPITRQLEVYPYMDPNFTPRDIGNYGDIEYMSAEHDDLPYYNYYLKPNSLKGKSVVVYNDRLGKGTNESVALDILSHGLREQDPIWTSKYLPDLYKAFEEDARYFAKKDSIPNDELQEYIDSYVDGLVRNMLVSDEMRGASSLLA